MYYVQNVFWSALLYMYIYSLGQNKMEQQTPISPKSGMKGKNAPFSHPWFGEEGGSRFSIYFVQDCSLFQSAFSLL